MGNAFRSLHDFGIRRLDKGGPIRSFQMIKQLFFASINPILATKTLQMSQTRCW